MEDWKVMMDHLPFTVMAAVGKPTLNFSRILEALVISGAAALASSYLTVQELNVRMAYFENEMRQQMGEAKTTLAKHDDKLSAISEQLGELKGRAGGR